MTLMRGKPQAVRVETLNPSIDAGDITRGVLLCECPCGGDHSIRAPFAPAQEPGRWQATGSTIETLTLRPSIAISGCCEWHGFLTRGEFVHV